MPTCIYCKLPTSDNEANAHVFPEALVQNDLLLPPGAVCTKCNQYLGHELDAALLHHTWIGFCVQFLALPGKKGRPRDRIGRVARQADGGVTIEVEEPLRTAGRAGTEMHVRIGPDKHFDVLQVSPRSASHSFQRTGPRARHRPRTQTSLRPCPDICQATEFRP